jgi:hypothetical protein
MLRMLYIPEISASKVAGLIGLNAYQAPHEIMYDLLTKHAPANAQMKHIEENESRISMNKLKNIVLATPAIKSIVFQGVQSCEGRTDILETLNDIEAKARVVIDLRHSDIAPDVRSILVNEVRGAVQKNRGLRNEDSILNAYEVEQKVEVKERNTKTFRKLYGSYKLIGRTDGYVKEHNRIVDSKARTRWREEVPIYDEIQMRVYMDMSGAKESELVESFPDGRTRNTKFTNDADKWASINTAIRQAVTKINTAIEDPVVLREIVFANTVKV